MSDKHFFLEGTSENFDHLVIENSRKGLVLVDFWASWVGPSLRQQAILTDLVQRYAGRFLLVSVNTDEQKRLAERFGVRSLPNLKLFRHGELVAEYHGVQPEADYPRIIEEFVAKQLDPVSKQAVAAWQSGEAEQALQILADAALEAPAKLDYPLLMAKILLREGREEDAHALLSSIPEEAGSSDELDGLLTHLDILLTARQAADEATLQQRVSDHPGDAQARYQLAAVQLTEDKLESALEQLLYLSRHHAGFRDGIARKGMKSVLDRLESSDERVARYRRELYRLNY